MTRRISWVQPADYPQILDIEYDSFNCPWDEEELHSILKKSNHYGIVLEKDHEVVGYIIYHAQIYSYDILNVAISKNYRRKKYGTILVRHLIKKLIKKRHRITVRVKETNIDAQKFFSSLDFKVNNVFKLIYQDTDEDSYLFVYNEI